MTTTTMPAARKANGYRLTDVVRSEWTKFISLRSSRWTIAVFALTGLALGVLISRVSSSHYAQLSLKGRVGWDPTNNTLAGLALGYLALPVLGLLMMTTEYGSGSIRSTLAAVPRRPLVLAAKALVFGLVALAVGEVVTLVTFLAGQMVTGTAPHATLSQPGVLRAVLLSGAFFALLGVFALGLGAIVRRSAWAIVAYTGLILVVPNILRVLPGNLGRLTPLMILGNSVAAVRPQTPFLSAWMGFAVMAAYAAAALVAGGILLVRRDA